MRPALIAVRLGDPPDRWEALGFSVKRDGCDIGVSYSHQSRTGTCELGGVRLRLGCPGKGITGWVLSGVADGTRQIDGLETEVAGQESPSEAPTHPNGAIAIDHVVVTTPDFDRTAAALQGAGMPLRRGAERPDGRRMGFRRLGPAILELVEAEGDRSSAADASFPAPARVWGLVVVVENLDALAERLGEQLGSIRDAVQPGRRIATLRQSAGLGEAVAFMSSEPH